MRGLFVSLWIIGIAMTLNDYFVWADPGPASSLTFRVVWTVVGLSCLLASIVVGIFSD